MNLSFNEVNKIIKTLPIGYYICRNVDLTLDEKSNTSFYAPMDDKIVVSYPTIASTLSKIDNMDDVEEIIRTLTYHETSHALLTPKTMMMTKQMNIFEDERIETLLAKFYMRTNFKKFVKMVNDFHGEPAKSADEEFYQLVRFRVGDADFLKRVEEIIEEYKSINHSSKCFFRYERKVQSLYNDVCDRWNSKQNDTAQLNNNENQNTDGLQEKSSETKASSQDESTGSDSLGEKTYINGNGEKSDKLENEPYDFEEAKELLQNSIDSTRDVEIMTQVESILSRISNASKRNGSAINSYSGVFDPRSVVRNDYKYFVQQNRSGHVKAYAKTHLTLFIDRSGSFDSNASTVNKLLYALKKFEEKNPDFSFDLVTMGVGEKVEDRSQRELTCKGGNLLDEMIFDIYKRMQIPSCVNYNIVLFDGYAFSDRRRMQKDEKEYFKNFAAFNNSNCSIISDEDNQKFISKFCKNAKVTITVNYTQVLIKNVMKALENIAR